MKDPLKELKELMTMIYNSNTTTSEKGSLIDKAEKVGIAFIEEKYDSVTSRRGLTSKLIRREYDNISVSK